MTLATQQFAKFDPFSRSSNLIEPSLDFWLKKQLISF